MAGKEKQPAEVITGLTHLAEAYTDAARIILGPFISKIPGEKDVFPKLVFTEADPTSIHQVPDQIIIPLETIRKQA